MSTKTDWLPELNRERTKPKIVLSKRVRLGRPKEQTRSIEKVRTTVTVNRLAPNKEIPRLQQKVLPRNTARGLTEFASADPMRKLSSKIDRIIRQASCEDFYQPVRSVKVTHMRIEHDFGSN